MKLSSEANQRMWDLIRQVRWGLYTDGLITYDELLALTSDEAAVKRLEDYDVAQTELRSLRATYESR